MLIFVNTKFCSENSYMTFLHRFILTVPEIYDMIKETKRSNMKIVKSLSKGENGYGKS